MLNPRSRYSFFLRGDAYLLNGEFDKAEEEFLKILEISGDKSTHFGPKFALEALYLTQGKIEKGKREVEQRMSLAAELNIKAQQAGSQFSHSILVSLKDPEQALKEAEKALIGYQELDNLSMQRLVMYREGTYQIKMGSIDEAQRISNELKDITEKGLNKKAMRYHHGLEGAIELENKNYARAIEHFNKTISLLPFQNSIYDQHALFMEPLALVYYRSGDLEKAQKEYDRITTLTTGRFLYGDIYAKSFYMLGKIYEQQGDTVKAIEHYEKFLSLWKDADPGLPEVDDAKQRLAGLKRE